MNALAAVAMALLLMLAEQFRSRANETALRRQGAFEPPGDVYRAMAWVYPASFVAMGAEGWWHAGAGSSLWGLAIFGVAKLLKYWAIVSLGPRWTFRVLVLPGAPLVTRGPYAWVRHPNYIAVIGELIGFAVLVGAPGTAVVVIYLFARLLRRRVKIEDRALRGT